MEKIIALIASLPQNSKMRLKLSQQLVGTLWDTLQHPPLSYYGDLHQYRTADGSYNVVTYLEVTVPPSLTFFRTFFFQILARPECPTPKVVVRLKLYTVQSQTPDSFSIVGARCQVETTN